MRTATTPDPPADGRDLLPTHVRVAIVGTGFSGLGMAIRLTQAGIDDFLVLERGDDVGGTWRDNSYPGAACDVQSHLYSFSFAPNPDWSHSFSRQPEILDYLRGCADRWCLWPRILLRNTVTDARWDEAARRWRVTTSQGRLTADFLVIGAGPLAAPSIPDLPGIDSFTGTRFHSATWDHDHDLTGDRVAVIGTGASAIQFVPQIQPIVDRLHVFQRTPPWIVPRRDRAFSQTERALFRSVPALRRLVRNGLYLGRESLALGFTVDPRITRFAERLALAHLNRQVSDPDLRRSLVPDYRLGCKRCLVSDDYYPALTRENVELVTDGIKAIRPRSIVTTDGTERPVDTIIFGTGFHATDLPAAHWVRGTGGTLLADAWASGMQAYKGTTVAGFPNMFLLIGPNTGLGHTSIVYMIESQLNYVIDALRFVDRSGAATLDVLPTAQSTFNTRLQERMGRTVWNTGGCRSWYLDDAGRNTTLWPTFTWEFRWATRRFDPSRYRATRRTPTPAPHISALRGRQREPAPAVSTSTQTE